MGCSTGVQSYPICTTVLGLTVSYILSNTLQISLSVVWQPVLQLTSSVLYGPGPIAVTNSVNRRGHLHRRSSLATLGPVLSDAGRLATRI